MGCHMLVEVGYGRPGPNEPYESAFDAFQANKIRDWNDSRIPDGFRVRVWPSPVARINITDDGSFAHALQQLATTPPLYDKVFALGTAMPQPDRGMYITQFALGAATDLHVGAMRDDSLVDYLLEPNSMNHVRQQVQGMAGVTPVEAAGLQAFPIMCAYQVGLTAPKVRKKIFERETANLPMANLADIGLPSTAGRAAPKRKGDDARPDAAKQPRRE
jgi:hypothetical protein